MVDARLPADARLPRGARVNVVLPPLSLTGPSVTIRLFPKAYGLAELLQRGTLDKESADLLSICVRARANIVVSGGTVVGQDHVPERAVAVRAVARADRHHRGRRRALAATRIT